MNRRELMVAVAAAASIAAIPALAATSPPAIRLDELPRPIWLWELVGLVELVERQKQAVREQREWQSGTSFEDFFVRLSEHLAARGGKLYACPGVTARGEVFYSFVWVGEKMP